MPRVSQEHQERQRRRILEQAIGVFAERGYGLTTVDEICRRAGLSKGALYGYFPSKEDLFIAALRETFERRYRTLAEVSLEKLPVLDQVRLLVDRLATYVNSEDQAFIRLWVEGYLQSNRLPVLEEMKTAYRAKFGEFVEGVVRAGQREGELDPRLDPRTAADTVLALADGLMLHSLVPGWKVDSRRIVGSLSELFRPAGTGRPGRPGSGPGAR